MGGGLAAVRGGERLGPARMPELLQLLAGLILQAGGPSLGPWSPWRSPRANAIISSRAHFQS